MSTSKQHRNDKLQKSSILFMQLGLVLALLIVYLALEFTSVKKVIILDEGFVPDPVITLVTEYPDIIIKRAELPKEQAPVKEIVTIVDPIIQKDQDNFETVFLAPPEDNEPTVTVGEGLPPEVNPIEEGAPIPLVLVEEAPIYPGCEGLDKKAAKVCFTQKVSKFVNKKFNTSLAGDLNLTGKQRIYVQFKIDESGKVIDIIAKASHRGLEKEATRIVQKLPQMTPGKQQRRPVKVKYTLPIVFVIQ